MNMMLGKFIPATGWTMERIAVLTRMWAEGISTPDIASALGDWCNKNKVIGKARRLGLGQHVNDRNRAAVAQHQRKAEKRRKPSPKPVVARKPVLPAPVVPVAAAEPSDVPWVSISILQTMDATAFRAGRCKWPVNNSECPDGHLFCGGHTSEGAVYCATHQRAAYTPVPRRQNIFAGQR